jgi:anthranilate synthase/aminodeoxychorismate synthase-like glutamine amidotransferase
MRPSVLFIDNYDSFTYNLVELVRREAVDVQVCYSDDMAALNRLAPEADAFLISPGPGHPSERIALIQLLRRYLASKPMLGVCLGHQLLLQITGADIVPAPAPRHGKTSLVIHSQQSIFSDLPNPAPFMRYHSLIADRATVSTDWEILAEATDDHTIMAVQHQTLPLWGVQFHPESILSYDGPRLIANWIQLAVQNK